MSETRTSESGGSGRVRRLGGFRILDDHPLASGTEGVIWRAVCETPQLPGLRAGDVVVLKTMTGSDSDGMLFRRLERRTKSLVALDHPNVVRYRGCLRVTDEFNDVQVVVMDCLDGETLRERLRRNPRGLDADEGLEICEKVAMGLAAAAAAGLVHRDVKPSNVFICRDGQVKVIDFELAHAEGGTVSDATGKFMGTFNYMAPEFVDPKFRGDETSDVFSAGVLFHETLTGRLPYARGGRANQPDFDYLERWSNPENRRHSLNLSSRVSHVLPGFGEVLQPMLCVEPAGRMKSFEEVVRRLRAVRFREFRRGEVTYRLLREIGAGGFGEVFKARMLPANRFVAVKHLKDYANGDRFRREARLMQQLKDDHFTQFIDYFETEENMGRHAYIVMDFLSGMPGSSLRDAIYSSAQKGRCLVADEVVAAFCRYLQGLAVLHSRGIVHRDVKPANLYYPAGHPERSVIMDMGIARDVNGSITHGQVPGTLDYMPPEVVFRGSDESFRGDAKMDLYALGLCLYEALTGRQGFRRLPSGDAGLKEFYQRSRRHEAPDLSDAELLHRPSFHRLISELTDPYHERRLGSAEEALRRLSAMNWAADRQAKPVRASHPEKREDRDFRAERTTAPTPVANPLGLSGWTLSDGARRFLGRTVLVAASVAAVLALGAIVWSPASAWWNRIQAEKEKKMVAGLLQEANEAEATNAVAAVVAAFGESADAGERACEAWEQAWAAKAFPERSDVLGTCRAKVEAARLAAWSKSCEGELVPIERAFGETRSPGSVDAQEADWRRRWEAQWSGHDRSALEALEVRAADARRACQERLARIGEDAKNEADAVIGRYRNAVRLEPGNAAAEAWQVKWATNGLSAAALADVSNRFEVARRECASRLEGIARRDMERRERQRRIADSLPRAQDEARRVIEKYEADTAGVGSADRMEAEWQGQWQRFLHECGTELDREPDFRQLSDRIREAKQERALRRKESKIVSECEAIFRTIYLVTAENVKNWQHDCLDMAEAALAKADRDGYVSAASRRRLENEIERRRQWCVGVIVNRLHEPVSLVDETIGALSSQTLVFTNALPAGAALIVDGYEPRPIDAEHLNGQVVTVRADQLVERTGDAVLELPTLPEGTVAIVDGTLYSGGKVTVRSGMHEVAFRRLAETTPGTRDFLDIQTGVRALTGKTVKLAAPQHWTPNSAAAKARKDAQLSEKGDEIARACMEGLEPMPLDTRRARLEKVHALLSDWQTPSALGDRRMKDLMRRYEAESARAMGYVASEMDVPVKVKVYDKWVVVGPGEKAVVCYDSGYRDGMPKDAYVAVDGYECAFLPAKEVFDGGVYAVAKDLLRPKAVSVAIPSLDDDVTCRIDGAVVMGTAELAPGKHSVAYSRPGRSSQRFELAFEPGEHPTLPSPGEWKESGIFESAINVVSESVQGGISAVQKSLEESRRKNPQDGVK